MNCSSNIFTKYLCKFPKNEISIIVADIIELSLLHIFTSSGPDETIIYFIYINIIFKICFNSNIIRYFEFIFR